MLEIISSTACVMLNSDPINHWWWISSTPPFQDAKTSRCQLCWRLRIRYSVAVHMEGILYCCQYFLIHGKTIGSVTPIPNVAYHRYRDFTSVGRYKPQLALVSRRRHNFHPSSFIQFTHLVERRCEGENAKPENIIYLLCNLMNLH